MWRRADTIARWAHGPGFQVGHLAADPRCVGDPQADLLSPAVQSRCPACSAALRPGAPWCTLCYADLRPPEPQLEPPSPVPPIGSPTAQSHRFDPLTAPAQDRGLPGRHASVGTADTGAAEERGDGSPAPSWPCTACEQPNPFTAAVCATCGTAFLATLREGEEPLLRLPLVGDIGRFGRMQRLGLAALVVLVFIVFTAVLSLLTS